MSSEQEKEWAALRDSELAALDKIVAEHGEGDLFFHRMSVTVQRMQAFHDRIRDVRSQ